MQYDHLVGNVQPSSDDQTEQDTLSETLADGAGDSRANHGKHAQEIFDSKLFHDSITSLDQVEDESSEQGDPESNSLTVVGAGENAHEHEHEHNIFEIPKTRRGQVFWLVSLPLMVNFNFNVSISPFIHSLQHNCGF